MNNQDNHFSVTTYPSQQIIVAVVVVVWDSHQQLSEAINKILIHWLFLYFINIFTISHNFVLHI